MSPDYALELAERVRLGIRNGESLYREFKSCVHGAPGHKSARALKEVMSDIAETLVAFANADGGELLIGVEDDGAVTGLPYDEDGARALLDAPITHVHRDTPLPAPRRTIVDIDGKRVGYFSLAKGTTFIHLTSSGLCLKRVDRESIPVSVEAITAHRLEDASRNWDRESEYGATLDDLDLDLVRATSSQVAYGVSVEKFLQFFELADFSPNGLRLKRAAVMLFAKDIRRWHPGCFVRIMVIKGLERKSGEGFNVAKDTTVSESILKLVDAGWERLTLALSTHSQLTQGARFEQNLMYPEIACREALINAIVHRNYAIEGRGIEVSIFQDRMEIKSPGMLLSTITLDDIRKLKGAHESRNPFIARVLKEVGLVKELGEGIRRIYEVMRSNALSEPIIASDTTGFTVSLYNKSLYEPKVKLWLSTFDRFKLTQNQLAVLALGNNGKEFSTQDIIDRLGIVDVDEVREIITPLRKWGLIERTKDHASAMLYSRRNRTPKREVPSYRVVSAEKVQKKTLVEAAKQIAAGSKNIQASEGSDKSDDDTFQDLSGTRLYISNLAYKITKTGLVEFLSQHCEVQQLSVPRGDRPGAENRGFAFATVLSTDAAPSLVAKLDGTMLGGRLVSVRLDSKA